MAPAPRRRELACVALPAYNAAKNGPPLPNVRWVRTASLRGAPSHAVKSWSNATLGVVGPPHHDWLDSCGNTPVSSPSGAARTWRTLPALLLGGHRLDAHLRGKRGVL